MDDDPKIICSDHCTRFVRDGVTVDLQIYRLEDTDWSLEVVSSANTSIVWDDLFKTDDEALAESMRTVNEEGMIAFAEKKGRVADRSLSYRNSTAAFIISSRTSM